MYVSVVITCHNEGEYIKQSVNSVITQSDYKHINEIFVVDDGSTDSSPQILTQLKLNCDKLKIITTKTLGISAARNIAIKSSTSDFIAFLDGDDYWTKNKLQNQLKAFENNSSIGLIYGDFWDFEKSDASDAIFVPVRSLNNLHINQLVEYFIYDAPIIPSTTICRKKVFETVGLFDEKIRAGEDTEMFIRVAEKWKFLHVPGANCYKRKKKGSISHRQDKLLINQKITSNIAISRNPQLTRFAKKRESYRLLKAGIDCYIIHKEKKSALLLAMNSLKKNFFNFRAWALIFMILMPYKLTMILYNFFKNKFYQLRRKRIK